MTASGSGGFVDFTSTVDGAHNLAVNTGGLTTFGGVVGGTAALTSLTTDAAGSTMLAGNVSTTGAQIYNDALTLGANATLSSSGGGAIDFGSTVDGAHNLAVNTGGLTTFGGGVGGTTALTSLSTGGAGSTTLDGNVSTTGAQIYNDALTLGANATLSSSGVGAIDFASTVDGAHNLVVNTTGVTTFAGAAGSVTRLASLNVSSAAGSTILSGNVSTTGAQTYGNAVNLGGNAALATSGSGAIDFGSTLDGAHNLTVNSSGPTTFGGAVGGTTALISLATDAAGSTMLDGNVSTTGTQTYNNALTLGADATLTSTGNGAIDLAGTIDGAHSLTVHTGGVITFGAAVGGVTALTGLTLTSGTLAINANSIPMKISGNAHIGGTLSVTFDSTPSLGQSFTVLTAGSLTGTFATVNAAGLTAGTVAAVTYSATSVTLTIAQTAPDLTVSMTHDPTHVPYGGLVTYTITVHNVGNIGVANAQISNTLPAGLTPATPSWTCTSAGGASCTASGTGALADSLSIPLNPAASVTYLLNAWVDATTASESIQNTVTVTVPGDVNPANNTASDTVQIVLFRDGFDPQQ
ncbi:MAG TPA: hypothetical protein VGH81_00035 [Rudaea sp.]